MKERLVLVLGTCFLMQTYVAVAGEYVMSHGEKKMFDNTLVYCPVVKSSGSERVTCRVSAKIVNSEYGTYFLENVESSMKGTFNALSAACVSCMNRIDSRDDSCLVDECFDPDTGDEIEISHEMIRRLPRTDRKRCTKY